MLERRDSMTLQPGSASRGVAALFHKLDEQTTEGGGVHEGDARAHSTAAWLLVHQSCPRGAQFLQRGVQIPQGEGDVMQRRAAALDKFLYHARTSGLQRLDVAVPHCEHPLGEPVGVFTVDDGDTEQGGEGFERLLAFTVRKSDVMHACDLQRRFPSTGPGTDLNGRRLVTASSTVAPRPLVPNRS